MFAKTNSKGSWLACYSFEGWRCLNRYDSPFMFKMCALYVKRSTNAAVNIGSSNSSVQRENSRFVLMMMLALSVRSAMSLNSNSECLRLKVMYERSSMIKRAALLIACSRRRNWYLSWASANSVARAGAL